VQQSDLQNRVIMIRKTLGRARRAARAYLDKPRPPLRLRVRWAVKRLLPWSTSAESDVDRLVDRTFFGHTKFGALIEVGAAKPDYLSVSARFRRRGWRIISMEPNPFFCEFHRKKGLDIIQCACGASDQDDVSFYVVKTFGVYHGHKVTNESFSSLGIKEKYAKMMDNAKAEITEIKVNVRRLDTILKDTLLM
jgi:hypothetical protein